MEPQPAPERVDETGLTRPLLTVRYWAAARAAAGCAEETVEAQTVAAALDLVRRAHAGNPSFAKVLDVASFLLGEQPVTNRVLADVEVRDGDTLDVLPPFAGG
jgi:molybdopterin synthase sulfur carrier subunit